VRKNGTWLKAGLGVREQLQQLSFYANRRGNMPLVIISVLFGLSLLAAWVLFKVLKSTAAVTNKDYQLGGAAAGFVVILSLLSFTYMRVDDNTKQTRLTS
jgi:hypothetical protein